MKSSDTTLAHRESGPKVIREGQTSEAARKKGLSRKAKDNLAGFLFISPWIIGFLGLTLGPLLFSLAAGFTDYNITSKMNFIGLENYKRMFTMDDLFRTSLLNNIYYVIFSVPLTTAGAIILTVLLNQRIN
ncbi:carbohydrate ABC transporter permease [Mesobacillus jeotgali]|uniref:carbohydrate ABC transporter permease n=1 Tax=Mesobacillus jeotgali TaxID=129985 RepID=UPI001CFF00A7|nr:hypothetical protein [Mesobacillus jeotgali]